MTRLSYGTNWNRVTLTLRLNYAPDRLRNIWRLNGNGKKTKILIIKCHDIDIFTFCFTKQIKAQKILRFSIIQYFLFLFHKFFILIY